MASSARAVVQRRAVDPFQRQHFARGAVPVDRRHAEVRDRPWCSPPSRRARRLPAADPFRVAPSARSVSTTSIRRSRRASAERCLGVARGKAEGVEVAPGSAARCPAAAPSRQPARAALGVDDLGAMHLRDRGGRDRPGRRSRRRLASGWSSAAATAARPRPAGTAPSCPAGFPDRARARSRPRPAASPGTARASHRLGPSRVSAADSRLGTAGAGRPLDQPRKLQRRARRQRQRARIDQRQHAFAGEHEAGARQPGEMGEAETRAACDHSRQPECSATMPPVMR